jgi:divalent metal cation (Fe/Co/Zn/Cd) transporter
VLTTSALAVSEAERGAAVRRGIMLSRLTLAYNAAEGIAALVAGGLAGSIALVGFGVDSVIEVVSSVASLWRLHSDLDPTRRAAAERRTRQIIGMSFLALALYIAHGAAHALLDHEIPRRTVPGTLIAALSVIVMPLLARAKRRVATTLGSRALRADATQTDLCAYLSAILLIGLALNVTLGWWWSDPIAALIMSPIIAQAGFEALRGEPSCDDCP